MHEKYTLIHFSLLHAKKCDHTREILWPHEENFVITLENTNLVPSSVGIDLVAIDAGKLQVVHQSGVSGNGTFGIVMVSIA